MPQNYSTVKSNADILFTVGVDFSQLAEGLKAGSENLQNGVGEVHIPVVFDSESIGKSVMGTEGANIASRLVGKEDASRDIDAKYLEFAKFTNALHANLPNIDQGKLVSALGKLSKMFTDLATLGAVAGREALAGSSMPSHLKDVIGKISDLRGMEAGAPLALLRADNATSQRKLAGVVAQTSDAILSGILKSVTDAAMRTASGNLSLNPKFVQDLREQIVKSVFSGLTSVGPGRYIASSGSASATTSSSGTGVDASKIAASADAFVKVLSQLTGAADKSVVALDGLSGAFKSAAGAFESGVTNVGGVGGGHKSGGASQGKSPVATGDGSGTSTIVNTGKAIAVAKQTSAQAEQQIAQMQQDVQKSLVNYRTNIARQMSRFVRPDADVYGQGGAQGSLYRRPDYVPYSDVESGKVARAIAQHIHQQAQSGRAVTTRNMSGESVKEALANAGLLQGYNDEGVIKNAYVYGAQGGVNTPVGQYPVSTSVRIDDLVAQVRNNLSDQKKRLAERANAIKRSAAKAQDELVQYATNYTNEHTSSGTSSPIIDNLELYTKAKDLADARVESLRYDKMLRIQRRNSDNTTPSEEFRNKRKEALSAYRDKQRAFEKWVIEQDSKYGSGQVEYDKGDSSFVRNAASAALRIQDIHLERKRAEDQEKAVARLQKSTEVDASDTTRAWLGALANQEPTVGNVRAGRTLAVRAPLNAEVVINKDKRTNVGQHSLEYAQAENPFGFMLNNPELLASISRGETQAPTFLHGEASRILAGMMSQGKIRLERGAVLGSGDKEKYYSEPDLQGKSEALRREFARQASLHLIPGGFNDSKQPMSVGDVYGEFGRRLGDAIKAKGYDTVHVNYDAGIDSPEIADPRQERRGNLEAMVHLNGQEAILGAGALHAPWSTPMMESGVAFKDQIPSPIGRGVKPRPMAVYGGMPDITKYPKMLEARDPAHLNTIMQREYGIKIGLLGARKIFENPLLIHAKATKSAMESQDNMAKLYLTSAGVDAGSRSFFSTQNVPTIGKDGSVVGRDITTLSDDAIQVIKHHLGPGVFQPGAQARSTGTSSFRFESDSNPGFNPFGDPYTGVYVHPEGADSPINQLMMGRHSLLAERLGFNFSGNDKDLRAEDHINKDAGQGLMYRSFNAALDKDIAGARATPWPTMFGIRHDPAQMAAMANGMRFINPSASQRRAKNFPEYGIGNSVPRVAGLHRWMTSPSLVNEGADLVPESLVHTRLFDMFASNKVFGEGKDLARAKDQYGTMLSETSLRNLVAAAPGGIDGIKAFIKSDPGLKNAYGGKFSDIVEAAYTAYSVRESGGDLSQEQALSIQAFENSQRSPNKSLREFTNGTYVHSKAEDYVGILNKMLSPTSGLAVSLPVPLQSGSIAGSGAGDLSRLIGSFGYSSSTNPGDIESLVNGLVGPGSGDIGKHVQNMLPVGGLSGDWQEGLRSTERQAARDLRESRRRGWSTNTPLRYAVEAAIQQGLLPKNIELTQYNNAARTHVHLIEAIAKYKGISPDEARELAFPPDTNVRGGLYEFSDDGKNFYNRSEGWQGSTFYRAKGADKNRVDFTAPNVREIVGSVSPGDIRDRFQQYFRESYGDISTFPAHTQDRFDDIVASLSGQKGKVGVGTRFQTKSGEVGILNLGETGIGNTNVVGSAFDAARQSLFGTGNGPTETGFSPVSARDLAREFRKRLIGTPGYSARDKAQRLERRSIYGELFSLANDKTEQEYTIQRQRRNASGHPFLAVDVTRGIGMVTPWMAKDMRGSLSPSGDPVSSAYNYALRGAFNIGGQSSGGLLTQASIGSIDPSMAISEATRYAQLAGEVEGSNPELALQYRANASQLLKSAAAYARQQMSTAKHGVKQYYGLTDSQHMGQATVNSVKSPAEKPMSESDIMYAIGRSQVALTGSEYGSILGIGLGGSVKLPGLGKGYTPEEKKQMRLAAIRNDYSSAEMAGAVSELESMIETTGAMHGALAGSKDKDSLAMRSTLGGALKNQKKVRDLFLEAQEQIEVANEANPPGAARTPEQITQHLNTITSKISRLEEQRRLLNTQRNQSVGALIKSGGLTDEERRATFLQGTYGYTFAGGISPVGGSAYSVPRVGESAEFEKASGMVSVASVDAYGGQSSVGGLVKKVVGPDGKKYYVPVLRQYMQNESGKMVNAYMENQNGFDDRQQAHVKLGEMLQDARPGRPINFAGRDQLYAQQVLLGREAARANPRNSAVEQSIGDADAMLARIDAEIKHERAVAARLTTEKIDSIAAREAVVAAEETATRGKKQRGGKKKSSTSAVGTADLDEEAVDEEAVDAEGVAAAFGEKVAAGTKMNATQVAIATQAKATAEAFRAEAAAVRDVVAAFSEKIAKSGELNQAQNKTAGVAMAVASTLSGDNASAGGSVAAVVASPSALSNKALVAAIRDQCAQNGIPVPAGLAKMNKAQLLATQAGLPALIAAGGAGGNVPPVATPAAGAGGGDQGKSLQDTLDELRPADWVKIGDRNAGPNEEGARTSVSRKIDPVTGEVVRLGIGASRGGQSVAETLVPGVVWSKFKDLSKSLPVLAGYANQGVGEEDKFSPGMGSLSNVVSRAGAVLHKARYRAKVDGSAAYRPNANSLLMEAEKISGIIEMLDNPNTMSGLNKEMAEAGMPENQQTEVRNNLLASRNRLEKMRERLIGAGSKNRELYEATKASDDARVNANNLQYIGRVMNEAEGSPYGVVDPRGYKDPGAALNSMNIKLANILRGKVDEKGNLREDLSVQEKARLRKELAQFTRVHADIPTIAGMSSQMMELDKDNFTTDDIVRSQGVHSQMANVMQTASAHLNTLGPVPGTEPANAWLTRSGIDPRVLAKLNVKFDRNGVPVVGRMSGGILESLGFPGGSSSGNLFNVGVMKRLAGIQDNDPEFAALKDSFNIRSGLGTTGQAIGNAEDKSFSVEKGAVAAAKDLGKQINKISQIIKLIRTAKQHVLEHVKNGIGQDAEEVSGVEQELERLLGGFEEQGARAEHGKSAIEGGGLPRGGVAGGGGGGKSGAMNLFGDTWFMRKFSSFFQYFVVSQMMWRLQTEMAQAIQQTASVENQTAVFRESSSGSYSDTDEKTLFPNLPMATKKDEGVLFKNAVGLGTRWGFNVPDMIRLQSIWYKTATEQTDDMDKRMALSGALAARTAEFMRATGTESLKAQDSLEGIVRQMHLPLADITKISDLVVFSSKNKGRQWGFAGNRFSPGGMDYGETTSYSASLLTGLNTAASAAYRKGIQPEMLSAILTSVSDSSYKTPSEVGISLNRMLTSFSKSQALKYFGSERIEMFNRDFVGWMDQFAVKMNKMLQSGDPRQVAEANMQMAKVSGGGGSAGFQPLPLIVQNWEQIKTEYLRNKMVAPGETLRTASDFAENYDVAIKRFTAAMNTLAIVAGNAVLPVLGDVAKKLSALGLQFVKFKDEIGGLATVLINAIIGMSVVRGLGILHGAAGTLGKFTGTQMAINAFSGYKNFGPGQTRADEFKKELDEAKDIREQRAILYGRNGVRDWTVSRGYTDLSPRLEPKPMAIWGNILGGFMKSAGIMLLASEAFAAGAAALQWFSNRNASTIRTFNSNMMRLDSLDGASGGDRWLSNAANNFNAGNVVDQYLSERQAGVGGTGHGVMGSVAVGGITGALAAAGIAVSGAAAGTGAASALAAAAGPIGWAAIAGAALAAAAYTTYQTATDSPKTSRLTEIENMRKALKAGGLSDPKIKEIVGDSDTELGAVGNFYEAKDRYNRYVAAYPGGQDEGRLRMEMDKAKREKDRLIEAQMREPDTGNDLANTLDEIGRLAGTKTLSEGLTPLQNDIYSGKAAQDILKDATTALSDALMKIDIRMKEFSFSLEMVSADARLAQTKLGLVSEAFRGMPPTMREYVARLSASNDVIKSEIRLRDKLKQASSVYKGGRDEVNAIPRPGLVADFSDLDTKANNEESFKKTLENEAAAEQRLIGLKAKEAVRKRLGYVGEDKTNEEIVKGDLDYLARAAMEAIGSMKGMRSVSPGGRTGNEILRYAASGARKYYNSSEWVKRYYKKYGRYPSFEQIIGTDADDNTVGQRVIYGNSSVEVPDLLVKSELGKVETNEFNAIQSRRYKSSKPGSNQRAALNVIRDGDGSYTKKWVNTNSPFGFPTGQDAVDYINEHGMSSFIEGATQTRAPGGGSESQDYSEVDTNAVTGRGIRTNGKQLFKGVVVISPIKDGKNLITPQNPMPILPIVDDMMASYNPKTGAVTMTKGHNRITITPLGGDKSIVWNPDIIKQLSSPGSTLNLGKREAAMASETPFLGTFNGDRTGISQQWMDSNGKWNEVDSTKMMSGISAVTPEDIEKKAGMITELKRSELSLWRSLVDKANDFGKMSLDAYTQQYESQRKIEAMRYQMIVDYSNMINVVWAEQLRVLQENVAVYARTAQEMGLIRARVDQGMKTQGPSVGAYRAMARIESLVASGAQGKISENRPFLNRAREKTGILGELETMMIGGGYGRSPEILESAIGDPSSRLSMLVAALVKSMNPGRSTKDLAELEKQMISKFVQTDKFGNTSAQKFVHDMFEKSKKEFDRLFASDVSYRKELIDAETAKKNYEYMAAMLNPQTAMKMYGSQQTAVASEIEMRRSIASMGMPKYDQSVASLQERMYAIGKYGDSSAKVGGLFDSLVGMFGSNKNLQGNQQFVDFINSVGSNLIELQKKVFDARKSMISTTIDDLGQTTRSVMEKVAEIDRHIASVGHNARQRMVEIETGLLKDRSAGLRQIMLADIQNQEAIRVKMLTKSKADPAEIAVYHAVEEKAKISAKAYEQSVLEQEKAQKKYDQYMAISNSQQTMYTSTARGFLSGNPGKALGDATRAYSNGLLDMISQSLGAKFLGGTNDSVLMSMLGIKQPKDKADEMINLLSESGKFNMEIQDKFGSLIGEFGVLNNTFATIAEVMKAYFDSVTSEIMPASVSGAQKLYGEDGSVILPSANGIPSNVVGPVRSKTMKAAKDASAKQNLNETKRPDIGSSSGAAGAFGGGPVAVKLAPKEITGWIDGFLKKDFKGSGITRNMVLAVMQAESGFNADALSPVGARGLMQLMPRTADGLGVNIDDPRSNVYGGIKLLAQLYKKTGGNFAQMLEMYNSGHLHGGSQNMPAETRAYIPRVLGLYSQLQSQGVSKGVAGVSKFVKPSQAKGPLRGPSGFFGPLERLGYMTTEYGPSQTGAFSDREALGLQMEHILALRSNMGQIGGMLSELPGMGGLLPFAVHFPRNMAPGAARVGRSAGLGGFIPSAYDPTKRLSSFYVPTALKHYVGETTWGQRPAGNLTRAFGMDRHHRMLSEDEMLNKKINGKPITEKQIKEMYEKAIIGGVDTGKYRERGFYNLKGKDAAMAGVGAAMGLYGIFNGARDPNSSPTESMLGGLMTGASAGAAFGPHGALVGAVVGGFAAVLGLGKKRHKLEEKIFDQMPKRSDQMWTAPGFLPFSAMVSGRGYIVVNVNGASGFQASDVRQAAIDGVTAALKDSYSRGLIGVG